MPEYRYGALFVVEEARDNDTVAKDLRAIDDRLFLERQVDFYGDVVWCVCVHVGGDQPPLTLLEWRAPDGEPLELSSGIVARMASMERDSKRLTDRAIDANRKLVASAQEKSRAQYEEIARDMIPRMDGTRSAVLPRSQALRMSRDKRRAKGERI